jgi:uncharacterized protein (TIGR02145 family)
VTIGTQIWAAENLNCDVEGSKCYGDDPANCNTYGRLYDWSTAMGFASSCNSTTCSNQVQTKHKGICPSGWHIPSNAEWTALTDYVGGSSTAGSKLKATSGWYNNRNGTDDYGFSALPGGDGNSGGSFSGVGRYGVWWSATDYPHDAISRDMNYDSGSVFNFDDKKSNLFSVRCLQD